MSTHQRRDPRTARRPKRRDLEPREALGSMPDGGKLEVTVGLGIAMPWEVLRACQHPRLLKPTNERDPMGHHRAGIASECAIADDWIVRIGIDIHHRREIHVEANRTQLLAHLQRNRRCQGEIVGIAEATHRRHVEERGTEPRHPSPLLIDTDERRELGRRSGRDRLIERSDGISVADVAFEQNGATSMAGCDGAAKALRQSLTDETSDDELTTDLLEIQV